jgi:formate-dependent nitrite reductase membrane component NrfD
MKPYEWMVTYTPQTDWIKGGGVIVWLSFFTGIFGSGAYLASLYFNNLTGMVVSWLIIVVLKGGLHIGHAKRPLRLWRMVLKVRTSWIARGTVFTGLVALFGAIQIFLSFQMPGTTAEFVFKVLTGAAAFAVMIYEGFTINYISSIPFWNSSLLPATFISWGMLIGLALVFVIVPNGTVMGAVAALSRIVLIITIVLTTLYLWNALYAGDTSKESMKEMVREPLFWIGAVLIGFLIPLIIMFDGGVSDASSAIAFLTCEIIGGLTFTYSVFKAGVYRPLI